MKETLQAQDVHNVITSQIARRERRVDELRREFKKEIITAQRLLEIATTVSKLEHSIGTLIELEHALRLCGCPDEAYASQGAP